MGSVFISYRRGDSEGQARLLSLQLEELLGEDSVFMDVDSIALGRDFRDVLAERLQSCDLMLALIGPDWIDAVDSRGTRRLDSPTDFVRQEIATALKRKIRVTPVFLQGAPMPSADRLPDDLKDLAYRNGFELSHTRWESDFSEMVRRLGLTPMTIAQSPAPPRAQGPATTAVADAEQPPSTYGTHGSAAARQSAWPKRVAIGGGAIALALVALFLLGNDQTQDDTGEEPPIEESQSVQPATPAAQPGVSPQLAPISCSQEQRLKSQGVDVGTSIEFVNQRSATVFVYWLDFEGVRQKYYDLPAGQTIEQGTYVTHPFLIADANGACLAIYVASAGSAVATVK
jgi:TIR domain/VHL beta domain